MFSPTLVTVALLAISIIFWPPKRRDFARRGIDPGLFNLKVWPARIYFFFKGHDVVESAYREAKNTPYFLQTLIDDVLVLPPKYLSELRMLPGTKLGASDALVTSVLGQYSGVDIILKDRQAYDVTRLQLTQSLPSMLPVLSQRADTILAKALIASTVEDCVEVRIQDVVSDVTLHTTLLAFLGPRLSENKELQELVKRHTNLVRDIAICHLFIPSFLRPWVNSFLPPSIRMRHLHCRMREIIFDRWHKDRGSHFDTLLRHLIETSNPVIEEDIVAKLLVVIGAALHTMTMSTTHAIVDLCAHPTLIPSLQEEASQHLPMSAPYSTDQVARLKKHDAFLKESQRFNSPNYLSFDRLTLAPISLPGNPIIPRGTYLCMAAGSMAMDPSFYPSPNIFSPQRFYAADSSSQQGTKRNLDFVSTESGNIHWGSGRFTCPGRWYASAMMKTVLALVVTRYDVMFPGGQTERLPNVYMDILVEPNPDQRVLFRRRKM